MKQELKFLIISTGYNCGGFAGKCVESVCNQSYRNFEAVFLSDGSEDNTYQVAHQAAYGKKNVRVISAPENKGAACRRYEIMKMMKPDEETVVLLLGLDDELWPNALERIKLEYDRGAWMTYGNWINQKRKMLPLGFLEFDEETHKTRNYRKVLYRSTAPNTFKTFLFNELPKSDFMLDGKWIDTTTESELMFSCLEMCGKDRIGLINEAIYLYNANLPSGTLNRLGRDYKMSVLERIKARPKKPLLKR